MYATSVSSWSRDALSEIKMASCGYQLGSAISRRVLDLLNEYNLLFQREVCCVLCLLFVSLKNGWCPCLVGLKLTYDVRNIYCCRCIRTLYARNVRSGARAHTRARAHTHTHTHTRVHIIHMRAHSISVEIVNWSYWHIIIILDTLDIAKIMPWGELACTDPDSVNAKLFINRILTGNCLL